MSNINLFEIISTMFVGLFGCNTEIEKEIKAYHENILGISNPKFFFYEFILHQPLPKNKILKERKIKQKDIWFFAPFIQRLAKKSIAGLDPDIPVYNKFKFLNEKDIAKSQVIIQFGKSVYMKNVYDKWSNKKKRKVRTKEGTTIEFIKIGSNKELKHLFIGKIKDYRVRCIDSYIKKNGNYIDLNNITNKAEKLNWHSRLIEYGFIKPLIGQIDEKQIIPAFILPIASNNLFYGEILIWLPQLKGKTNSEVKNDIIRLGSIIALCIKKHYVPTLAILHEHIIERIPDPAEMIKPYDLSLPYDLKTQYVTPFCFNKINSNIDDCNKCNKWKDSNDLIEDNIHSLWAKRIRNRIFLKESLIFSNYLISSPKMIEQLKIIIKNARQLKMVNTSLAAVLIVGAPGSGKNDIINFLRIFSDYYCKGERFFINLAGIKPDALVAPSIVGVDIQIASSNDSNNLKTEQSLNLSGVLEKIREDTIKRISDKNNENESKINLDTEEEIIEFKKNNCFYPTVILDELNSMNIDSQGILLRFIENAEIVPIGGAADHLYDQLDDSKVKDNRKLLYSDFLIIGVMNEDPDEISREKALDFIKREKYVSGLLGDLLYEHILKIRRLRPDLKYRLIRSGKITLLGLNQRREDIPILFRYYTVKKALPELFREGTVPDIYITLGALEKLISTEINWQGNIRQLQALAKIVAEIVWREYKDEIKIDTAIINEMHIDAGMKELGFY